MKKINSKDDYQSASSSLIWKIIVYGFVLVTLLLIVLFVYFSKFDIKSNNELNNKLGNKTNTQLDSQDKLKVCPEKWYIDNTPCDCNENGCESCNNQYVIINGVIHNIDLIDVQWMIDNCDVSLEIKDLN